MSLGVVFSTAAVHASRCGGPSVWRRCACMHYACRPPPATAHAVRRVASDTTSSSSKATPRRRRSRGRHVSDATSVPRSLDIAEVKAAVDVERHFATAMAHLKSAPQQQHVADEAARRQWHRLTHTRTADDVPTTAPLLRHRPVTAEDRAGVARSFFDQDSVDIRTESRKKGGAVSRGETESPDILQLTAGTARQDGLGLSERSNAAPADPTVEETDDDVSGVHEFGDTPVQLTDMLRERLMELKADKLSEERVDTFLPRRLRLEPDAARGPARQKGGRSAATTLADWPDGNGAVTSLLRGAADYIPGGGGAASKAATPPPALDAASEDDVDEVTRDAGEGAAAAQGDGVYLLRLLPRACLCSRREAVAMIASGQVRVNNVVERNPFRVVRAEEDVHVAGQSSRLRFAPPRLWMYHKPSYVIVSRNDPAGRALITRHARILGFDHLIAVGALPMRAHGVMLLTNDGELARFLQNPATRVQRTYLLRVRPAIDPVLAHRLNTEGIHINGRQYRDAEFFVNPATKSRFSLKVKVRGEAMPIAHLLQHLGRTVERGGRVSFGPFALGGLAVGSVREVTVPPFYAAHVGSMWQPFVERDWPYFRRLRVSRLRRLSRFRELTPKEVEELDSFSYDELRDALNFESDELSRAAAERNARLVRRPEMAAATALAHDFAPSASGPAMDIDTLSFAPEEPIIEDITAAAAA